MDIFFRTRYDKRRVICLLKGHDWCDWAQCSDGKFYRFCFRCEVAEAVGYTVGKTRV